MSEPKSKIASLKEKYLAKVGMVQTSIYLDAETASELVPAIKINGKVLSARRASFELFIGELLEKKIFVSKSCDNDLCVSPDHIVLLNGSQITSKGRDSGIKNWNKINKTRKEFMCGHPYTDKNTIKKSNKEKQCRMCKNEASKLWKRKKRSLE